MLILEIFDGFYPIPEAVFTTKEKLDSYLAKWCRGMWENQEQEEQLPENDKEAIQKYFEFWRPEEDYEIWGIEVDPT